MVIGKLNSSLAAMIWIVRLLSLFDSVLKAQQCLSGIKAVAREAKVDGEMASLAGALSVHDRKS